MATSYLSSRGWAPDVRHVNSAADEAQLEAMPDILRPGITFIVSYAATPDPVFYTKVTDGRLAWDDLPKGHEGAASYINSLVPYALPATIGAAGQVLAVNSSGDGLEWVTP